jgi:hypothetical protein
MKQKEGSFVIFCQGDKKELEEITCEEYEYILPEQLSGETRMRGLRTFLELDVYDIGIGDSTLELNLAMHGLASEMNADAVIHYTTDIYTTKTGRKMGYVRGTFLKKKRK